VAIPCRAFNLSSVDLRTAILRLSVSCNDCVAKGRNRPPAYEDRCLVCLVHMVEPDQLEKPSEPDRPHNVPNRCRCSCRNRLVDDRGVEDRTFGKPEVPFMAGSPSEGLVR
jgi:hypothetical protein